LTEGHSDTNDIKDLVLHDFNLTVPNKQLTEAEMIAYLADAVAYMMEHKMDFLLSLMYRLDIDEDKIAFALMPSNPEAANMALARIIWERQKQRIQTKKTYKQQNPNQWDWDMD
jgi:hypothetical protein